MRRIGIKRRIERGDALSGDGIESNNVFDKELRIINFLWKLLMQLQTFQKVR